MVRNESFAYLSRQRFLDVPPPSDRPAAPFGLAGIAWDGSTTFRPGARFGPDAIRQASHTLCDAIHPWFDVSPVEYLVDAGDLLLPNTSLDAMRATLAGQIPELLRARSMVWLGGDHSITLSVLRALRAQEGCPLALVHFDAHCDTWSSHFGEPSGHGTWVHEAVEEGLILPAATVQIGIRSAAERSARQYIPERGGQVLTARMLRGLESPSQLAPFIADIRARLRAAAAPVYLTLDIDCLDPAYAPGTGTPEPAGMSTAQLFTFLEELASGPERWVGMDCTEVAPVYDPSGRTATVAAHCVWTWLCARLHALGLE